MSVTQVIGIADCAVSSDPAAVLVTFALGSRVGGLLHLMLPESNLVTASAVYQKPVNGSPIKRRAI